MSPLQLLESWQSAGLIDVETASRIREWEAERQRPGWWAWSSWNWTAILAVAAGAVLLAAGVVLLVSNFWVALGGAGRTLLVGAVFAGLHAGGALARRRGYPVVGMALHAAGTLTLGALIAVVGEMFYFRQESPTLYLLWAAGAGAGWLILRDWPHALLFALLFPGWLSAEWFSAQKPGAYPVFAGWLALSLVYLGARRPGRGADGAVRSAIVWLGGILVLFAGVFTAVERRAIDAAHQPVFWMSCLAAAAVVCVAWLVLRGFSLPALSYLPLILGWVMGIYWLRPNLWATYGWFLLGAAGLVAWGVSEARMERINIGMAGIGLTLVLFFFTNVLDKLSRSLSLVALGAAFLVGGWALERTRRRLVSRAGR